MIFVIFLRNLVFPTLMFCSTLANASNLSEKMGAPPGGPRYEIKHKLFYIILIPRTPEQTAAFYYGRGFPKEMVDQLKKTCFITVGMRNQSKDILWLDIGNWRFHTKQGDLKRYMREYWRAEWAKINVPLRFQSTFRWTLVPEKLDYQPDESEGGNISLSQTTDGFSIDGKITVGKDLNGPTIPIRLDNVRCATDTTNIVK